MDQTLREEMQDYLTRLESNPSALLPATLSLNGYVLDGSRNVALIPRPLQDLAPGRHEIDLGGQPYRVLVAERSGKRYVFLFNQTLQQHRERQFLIYLGAGSLTLTLLSALFGFWLARRIVAPITQLAAAVGMAQPEASPPALPTDSSLIEVSELALAFERYLSRIQRCMERERMFTADVSHELRTPLAIIRGAVEVLEQDAGLDEKQRERIGRIDRASLDMTDLASALLHLAREENTPTPEHGECNLADVVRESVDKHRALAQSQTREIYLESRNDVRLPISRILAVALVDNLLGNALHHTGSGHVHVQLVPDRLVVSDNGKGMEEAERERVFERHYRGGCSDGAGIGLSLVKRICDLHGWKIRLESKPGLGTTVSLLFKPPPNQSFT